jgi:3-deoxy-D-manno-octulosonic acid (KDO) 8-phosphate synthase
MVRSNSAQDVLPSIRYGEENGFILIAGPCVVESREMIFTIAEKIHALAEKYKLPFVFKASYRKANRSRIDSFTGIGDEKALKILKEIAEQFSIPVITDVHSEVEARVAAQYVDVLQIPAFLCRQTDLLVACAQTGKSVSIKKGQFLSPEAMKFAIDKVIESGNKKVLITERGTTFGYQGFLTLPTHSSNPTNRAGLPEVHPNSLKPWPELPLPPEWMDCFWKRIRILLKPNPMGPICLSWIGWMICYIN